MTLWPISMLSRIFDSDERGDAGQPERRQDAEEQRRAAADLEAALRLDDLVDVVAVVLAEVGDDALPDRVELAAEFVDLVSVR